MHAVDAVAIRRGQEQANGAEHDVKAEHGPHIEHRGLFKELIKICIELRFGSRGAGGTVRPSVMATPMVPAITATSTMAIRIKRRGSLPSCGMVSSR